MHSSRFSHVEEGIERKVRGPYTWIRLHHLRYQEERRGGMEGGGRERARERPMTYVIKNIFAYLVDEVTAIGDLTRSPWFCDFFYDSNQGSRFLGSWLHVILSYIFLFNVQTVRKKKYAIEICFKSRMEISVHSESFGLKRREVHIPLKLIYWIFTECV